jgi:hypothetical protein
MSIEQIYLDWIQADLDGRLGGAERAELARHLLSNPEARVLRESLSRVCEVLDAVPLEEPPADLRGRIMAELQLQAPQHARVPAGSRGRLRSFGQAPAALRYAAAFVGGILVSTIAFELSSRPGLADQVHFDHLVGTMAPAGKLSSTPEATGRALDQARFELDRFTADVSLHGSARAPLVRVSAVAERDLQVIARLDGQEVRFGGFSVSQARPESRVAAFRASPVDGAHAVEIQIVEPATGAVLRRNTLRLDAAR